MNFIHAKRTRLARILAALALTSLVLLQMPVRLVSAAAENSNENAAPAQQSTEPSATKKQISSPVLDNTDVTEIVPAKPGNESPPSDPIAVTARRGGMIEKVLVKVDDRVTAGQPLLEIDSSEAKVQLRTAQARLRVAEADLDVAQAELAQLTKDFKVKTAMIERGVASSDSLPNLDRARGLLKKSEAMLAVAKSEVELAELTLSQFTVRAPADGVLWSIVSAGTWVPQDGGKLLAEIKNPDRERAASQRRVIGLQEQLERLRRERAELLNKYTQGHPYVLRKETQIKQTQASIREHREFQDAIK